MRPPLPTPVWPTDFRLLHADGGAGYWWWSPETGPEYDGTWPTGTEPPSGLMVTSTSLEDEGIAEVRHMDAVCISWEYGPETESGPWTQFVYEEDEPEYGVQWALDDVIRQVNEERLVASL